MSLCIFLPVLFHNFSYFGTGTIKIGLGTICNQNPTFHVYLQEPECLNLVVSLRHHMAVQKTQWENNDREAPT